MSFRPLKFQVSECETVFLSIWKRMDPAENVKPPVVPNDEEDDDDGVNKIKELKIDSEDSDDEIDTKPKSLDSLLETMRTHK